MLVTQIFAWPAILRDRSSQGVGNLCKQQVIVAPSSSKALKGGSKQWCRILQIMEVRVLFEVCGSPHSIYIFLSRDI